MTKTLNSNWKLEELALATGAMLYREGRRIRVAIPWRPWPHVEAFRNLRDYTLVTESHYDLVLNPETPKERQ